ncbi:MAG: 3-oxoacyl-ACP synthase [Comamonadaceae bacterium]|nr:MAG: 3-oxoacyl-ACP synthase [Comamonadaceae bacterium]
MQNFQVIRWAAWARGLNSQAAWRAWFDRSDSDALPDGPDQPDLNEVPALMRRRIDPLGRAAIKTVYDAAGDEPLGGPVVFVSRWGEVARSLALLQQLASEEGLSPTQFSLSVHNASGALSSMARRDRENYLAVAAGAHSAEAGVNEALGLLADGAPRVLVVCFDAPLPSAYAALVPEGAHAMTYAWACVLEAADGANGITLIPLPAAKALLPADRIPDDLAVLEFLVGQSPTLDRPGVHGGWRWSRKTLC